MEAVSRAKRIRMRVNKIRKRYSILYNNMKIIVVPVRGGMKKKKKASGDDFAEKIEDQPHTTYTG